MTFDQLAASWRTDADTLRRRGCLEAARLLHSCADDLDAARHASEDETLPLAEAARVSGYTSAHLRRLIAEGHLRNVATAGPTLVRRGDLPRKPGHGLRIA
ncbi:MAG: hypothetical protein ACHQ9S_25685 [Candidatus Binatia bacterium]